MSYYFMKFRCGIRYLDHIENLSLKVSRTIADLAEEENISPANLSEAIRYRMIDRYY